jgi:FHS family L-fucose permease-like MFS transporter
LTCLNDLIIPHLKSIFELSYAEAMLVQFAFFSSYFIFSYPSGMLVDRIGYKRALVTGLIIMASGAIGFLPAANLASFPIFLVTLVILAAGMTTVQVALNPYVSIIGPSATAASRLNLTQAFSSVGTFIAPFLGSVFILHSTNPVSPERLRSMSDLARSAYRAEQASSVRLPYIGLSFLLVLLAIALATVKLTPRGASADTTRDFRAGAFAEKTGPPDTIWRHPWLLAAAMGIFTYVGAEVAIGSLLINYMGLPEIGGLPGPTAGKMLMLYWGGAMVGRFAGSALLKRIRTGWILGPAAIVAALLVSFSVLTAGHMALGLMLAVGVCNSIMFPSIFTLGLQDLGPLTSKGSSLMVAAIVGGAIVPLAQGRLADSIGLHLAFLLPVLCYAYIAYLGMASIGRKRVMNISVAQM